MNIDFLRIRKVLLLCLLILPVWGWGLDWTVGVMPPASGTGVSASMPLFSRGVSSGVSRGELFDPASMFKLPAYCRKLGSVVQESPPLCWEEDCAQVREALRAIEEQEIPEIVLYGPEGSPDPVAEALGEEKRKAGIMPEPATDPDDFKGELVYRGQQGRSIQEEGKEAREERLESPFVSHTENNERDIRADRVAVSPIMEGRSFGPDSRYVYRGALNGVVYQPGPGDPENNDHSPEPSAPPPQDDVSEPPPSYDEVVENDDYFPLAEITQTTLVIRNGQLVWEPTLPVAVDVGQVLQVNPTAASGIDNLPQSIKQLDSLGEEQAAVVRATSILEIPLGITNKFSKLQEYHLDLIIDNSGSMGESDTGLSYSSNSITQLTRMEELKCRFRAMVPLLAAVSTQGITVRCLNGLEPQDIPGDMAINEKENLLHSIIDSFQPASRTPLNGALKASYDHASKLHRPTVAYIFTDGEPNDYGEKAFGVQGFINMVRRIRREEQPDFYPIGMMACTDKKSCIKWMNKLDRSKTLGRIQVMDDYFSERKEVYDRHGGLIPYTMGLYLAAALLGPVDQLLDNLDESEIFNKREVEEFMGYRITHEEYQRYLTSAREAVRNRKLWGKGKHPVDRLNREPIHLQGQPLFRVADGFMVSDAESDSDSDEDLGLDPDDEGMPDVEQCPSCTIL